MYVYRWEMMRDLLERHKDWDGDPYEALMVEYVDPLTGGPVFKTITFFVQMLRPGEKTQPLRQTASLLVAPFEGSGHSIVDGKRFDWTQFDTLAVPGGAWYEHVNASDKEPAVLFVASDEPALQASRCSRNGAAKATATSCAWSDPFRPSFNLTDGISPCPLRRTPSRLRISIVPAAARSGSTARRSMSGTCAIRAAPRSSTSPIRRSPRLLAHLPIPEGWHSHKVRAQNGIMIVNHEKLGAGGPADFTGGLAIYDVSKPAAPKLITKWMTAGKGVHRYDFDGRYAYISPTAEGYVGNIAMILDLADPAKPKEVGRWWIPGQWQAGGEHYPWGDGVAPRCHHPLRLGDRLYVSYWHHGLFILDISDMSKPKAIAHLNSSPAFPHPTHTCLRIPQKLKGRDIMVVADEDVAKL